MKNDANRRLANVKSRSELGLDYVMLQLEIMSPLGRRTMKENKPFFPGQEDKLRTELDNLDSLISFINPRSFYGSKGFAEYCFEE